jgi:hypothetical protein
MALLKPKINLSYLRPLYIGMTLEIDFLKPNKFKTPSKKTLKIEFFNPLKTRALFQ